MTSKQLTEAHRSLGFTSGRWAGSHVVRHKVGVNHLPCGSQGLRRDGILAALEEEEVAARACGSLLCTCIASQTPMYVSVPARKRKRADWQVFPSFIVISCLIFIHAAPFASVLLLCSASFGAAAAAVAAVTGFQLCCVNVEVGGWKYSVPAHSDTIIKQKKL